MVSYGFRSHFPRNSWRPLTSTGCSASEAAPRRVDPGRTRNPDRTLVESIHGNPKSQVFRKSLLRSLRGSKSSKFRSFTSFSSAMAMSIYSTLGNPVPTSGLQKSSQRPSKKDITASIAPPRALTVWKILDSDLRLCHGTSMSENEPYPKMNLWMRKMMMNHRIWLGPMFKQNHFDYAKRARVCHMLAAFSRGSMSDCRICPVVLGDACLQAV